MTAKLLQEQWPAIRARLKEKFPSLTDNDLAYILGQEEVVFDAVQRRTGLTREEIEQAVLDGLDLQNQAA